MVVVEQPHSPNGGPKSSIVAGARKHKAQVIANVVLFKSRSTAAVYAQVDRRLTVTVKVEVCHWRSAVLGNNKNPFFTSLGWYYYTSFLKDQAKLASNTRTTHE